MNKQELKEKGFKYIATQNCDSNIEVWARFSGWKDVIQYHYYYPKENTTVNPAVMTINYTQLQMFDYMNKVLNVDFFNKDIEYDKDNVWFREDN